MAKPNYQFEKKQREQAKQKKKAEKASRKAAATPDREADPGTADPRPAGEGDSGR